MALYPFQIDLTMGACGTDGEGVELTNEEVGELRKRIADLVLTFAVGLRPQGRGKGYAVYVLPESAAEIREMPPNG